MIAFDDTMRIRTLTAILLLLVLSICGCRKGRPVRLATTTSIDHAGLLEPLLAAFERETGVVVDALAVGSGKAMALTRRGDADVMITHDPEGEAAFIEDERPLLYRKVMCSDFILVGPSSDPAGIMGSESAGDAMTRIRLGDSSFVSRGDRSGTHAQELRLWNLARGRPHSSRLLETGQGMAATLRVASERSAYALSDRATFLKLRDSLGLTVLFDKPDPALFNCYAVTVPSGPRADKALQLAEWLTRGSGRDVIESFEVAGERTFRLWPDGVPDDRPRGLPETCVMKHAR